MISGPVGMRCRDCSSLRGTSLYKIPPVRLIISTIAALVVGIVGAGILSEISMGYIGILVGGFYGIAMAETLNFTSGRKRGPVIEALGVGCIVVGGLLQVAGDLIGGKLAGFSVLHDVLFAIGIVLAISACYSRLKYY